MTGVSVDTSSDTVDGFGECGRSHNVSPPHAERGASPSAGGCIRRWLHPPVAASAGGSIRRWLHPPVAPSAGGSIRRWLLSGVSVLQLSVCMAFASLPKSVPRCFTLFDTVVNVLLSYFLSLMFLLALFLAVLGACCRLGFSLVVASGLCVQWLSVGFSLHRFLLLQSRLRGTWASAAAAPGL